MRVCWCGPLRGSGASHCGIQPASNGCEDVRRPTTVALSRFVHHYLPLTYVAAWALIEHAGSKLYHYDKGFGVAYEGETCGQKMKSNPQFLRGLQLIVLRADMNKVLKTAQ